MIASPSWSWRWNHAANSLARSRESSCGNWVLPGFEESHLIWYKLLVMSVSRLGVLDMDGLPYLNESPQARLAVLRWEHMTKEWFAWVRDHCKQSSLEMDGGWVATSVMYSTVAPSIVFFSWLRLDPYWVQKKDPQTWCHLGLSLRG